jgi:hypothetical protein
LRQPDSGDPIDASKIAYISLPGPRARWNNFGISLGDLAAVYNTANDKLAFATVAEVGPPWMADEGSVALANELGIPAGPQSQGATKGIVYIVFPNSLTKRAQVGDEP